MATTKSWFGILFMVVFPFVGILGADNVQFHNLNSEYGISIREVNSVCSDDNGFIWYSSKMGILRYTIGNLKTYHLPYESGDIVTVSLEYAKGDLYAYTNNGQIFLYNPTQDCFELEVNIAMEIRNSHLIVRSILIDDTGKLWIASSNGLLYYTSADGLKRTSQSDNIQTASWKDKEHFFVATAGRIKVFCITDHSITNLYEFDNNKEYTVSRISYDSLMSTVWLGTIGNGLFTLREKEESRTLAKVLKIPHQPVLAITFISDSTLLVGIDGQGIMEINKEGELLNVYKEDADNSNSLRGNGVYDIYHDNNNRVWVCTYAGGASFFHQINPLVTQVSHLVKNNNSLVNNDVNSVLEDGSGNLWFATNNGLSYWNTEDDKWKTFFYKEDKSQVFLSLCEDSNGRIWAGSYSAGVYVLDRDSGDLLAHYKKEKTGDTFDLNFVFDIIEDQEGKIWVGGVRGNLYSYIPTANEFKAYGNYSINVISELNDSILLFGSSYGLLKFHKNSAQVETVIDGYLVYDIFIDNDVVWVGTCGNGIIRYNMTNKTSEIYSVDEGLPSNFVNSLELIDGSLWIGTEQGLCCLRDSNKTITTFNSINAINNVSFNYNSHHVMQNGKLIWGTNKGAVIFDPDEIKPVEIQGRIFFQELTISGRSIRELSNPVLLEPLDNLEEITLKYFQNNIHLEMLPIGVSTPDSKFSWKMEGLDKDWTKAGINRFLTYSNIPGGDYSLHIRMYNSSLSYVVAERSIRVRVVPPFWETLWFRILMVIGLGGLLVLVLMYYIYRLKKFHSEEKIRFFTHTAHDIRTALTLIKGPVEELNREEELSAKGLDYLQMATEQSQHLLQVVNRLMDFEKADVGKEKMSISMVDIVELIKHRVVMFESSAGMQNINLHYEPSCSKFMTAIDQSMMEKVLDNLLSNAIKYSYPDTSVKILLNCMSGKWVLEVQDQGMGINKKAQRQLFKEYFRAENVVNSKIVGSGIGLMLAKNYVKLHGGKISCTSQPQSGTTFQVTIPIKVMHKVTDNQVSTTCKSVVPKPVVVEINGDKNARSSKMKVLIVEDNDSLRKFLKSAMEAQFQVSLAEDGQQAWELIKKYSPDLVVSDILMPRMDGFQLCKKIKCTLETSHIPVILLTALTGKAHELNGLGMGADAYLTKPFDVTILQQRICTILENRKRVREKLFQLSSVKNNSSVLGNELNDKFLRKMVQVVKENISNPLFSKDDFASALNVSPSLLYKKSKALTGQSPNEFIKTLRLEYAVQLLGLKKYTITEVSEKCGFNSVAYFSNVFRKWYGKSPSQILPQTK